MSRRQSDPAGQADVDAAISRLRGPAPGAYPPGASMPEAEPGFVPGPGPGKLPADGDRPRPVAGHPPAPAPRPGPSGYASDPRSAFAPAPPPSPGGAGSRYWHLAFWVSLVLAAVAAMATIGTGAPVFGAMGYSAWPAGGFAAVAALLGLAAAEARQRAQRPRRGLATVAVVVAAALVGAFWVGGSHSVIIDGRAVFEFSREARTYRWVQHAGKDLATLYRAEALFVLGPVQARARAEDIADLERSMRSLSAHYAGLEVEKLPVPQLETIARDLATSADAASGAARLMSRLLTQPDDRLAYDFGDALVAYREARDAVGPGLERVGALYGFAVCCWRDAEARAPEPPPVPEPPPETDPTTTTTSTTTTTTTTVPPTTTTTTPAPTLPPATVPSNPTPGGPDMPAIPPVPGPAAG